MFVVQALCLVLFVAVSLVSCQNSLTLLNGAYTVTWKHLSATKEIQFTVTAKTTGYVALGISNFNSQMKDIDVMVGKVAGGTPSVEDRWSSSYGAPSNDTQQDFKLVKGTEANGDTVLTFKRKLDTGEAGKDIKIEVGKQYYLVAAVGSSDTFEQHGNAASNTRGYSPQKVTLVAQPLSPSPSTASSTSMRTPSPTTAVSSSPLTTSAIPQPTPTTTVTPTSSATPVSDNMVSFKDGSVSWTVDNKNSEITFTMKAKAIGWLGLGITEENSGMKNMDVAIGGVDSNMPYLNQYFSTSTFKPEINKLNNLKMISSHQDVDKRETTITFKRSWNTGDSRDIIIKPGTGYYLAWAYHKTGDTLTVHNERGYTDKVVLVKSSASSKASCISVVAMAIILVVLMMQ